jgi:hypothetical protein
MPLVGWAGIASAGSSPHYASFLTEIELWIRCPALTPGTASPVDSPSAPVDAAAQVEHPLAPKQEAIDGGFCVVALSTLSRVY